MSDLTAVTETSFYKKSWVCQYKFMLRNFSPFVGFLLWLLAIPSTFEGIKSFWGKLDIGSWQWWNFVLAGLGTALLVYGFYPAWEKYTRYPDLGNNLDSASQFELEKLKMQNRHEFWSDAGPVLVFFVLVFGFFLAIIFLGALT